MAGGRRVLITGRHGFTGQYVAKELDAAGWDVWGTGVRPPDQPDDRYVQADLTDRREITNVIERIKPDAVIHLAALAFVGHGTTEDFYHVNVIGTHLLLDALTHVGAGQSGVIVASSANVYGNAQALPISESTRPAPVNDYAASKLSMEHMAHLFADRLPLTITRPFNYTGRGQAQHFLVPKIVKHFKDRTEQIALGNLDVARDFSDVRDVAHAYRVILETQPAEPIINLCSGIATSLQTVLDLCGAITGHDIKVTVNPAFVRANELKTLTGDTGLLNTLIPWEKRHGLEDTLEWMLS